MNEPARSHLRSVPPVDLTDEQLLRAAAGGDRAAFTSIYRAHCRYVAGTVYRLLGSAGEVDDIVQDTFIAALHGLNQIDEPKALRRWLVTVAVRQVQRRLGQRVKKKKLQEELSFHSELSSNPLLSRQIEDLYEALDTLDPTLRLPWALARLEGHSLPDVAVECEVSLATAKRRIAEAERRIKRRLGHG